MFSRLHICIYALHILIYGNKYPYAQSKQYIYMQHKTLSNREQATNTAQSSSQHSILIQQSPPEATEGFYKETSQ